MWTPEGPHSFVLGTQNPENSITWGRHRCPLPGIVTPDSTVTFDFDVVAPTVPGEYHFQWKMLQEGVMWFGATSLDVVVQVRPIDEILAKGLFRLGAQNMLPVYARTPISFAHDGSPELSVIMVAHNNFGITLTALSTLRANFAGSLELILVDSGSTDETIYIDRFVMGARIIRFDSNIGFLRILQCSIRSLCGRCDTVFK